jgi:hypothetical protein
MYPFMQQLEGVVTDDMAPSAVTHSEGAGKR